MRRARGSIVRHIIIVVVVIVVVAIVVVIVVPAVPAWSPANRFCRTRLRNSQEWVTAVMLRLLLLLARRRPDLGRVQFLRQFRNMTWRHGG